MTPGLSDPLYLCDIVMWLGSLKCVLSICSFVEDWVFHGTCKDVYDEFIIQVNDVYLQYRGKLAIIISSWHLQTLSKQHFWIVPKCRVCYAVL